MLGHVLLKLGSARAAGLLVNSIVVHRPEDDAIRDLAAEYRAYPLATRSSDGELSDSLRSGLEAVGARESGREPAAVLICLGDQPLLRLEVISALIDSWGSGRVTAVRPSYRDSPGEPGHPFLIDSTLWKLARELRGDTGFAPVLAHRGYGIHSVSVAGRNPDVDTPEDLRALEEVAGAPLL